MGAFATEYRIDWIDMFLDDVSRRMASVEAEPIDWKLVGEEAHAVISLSGNLGLSELAKASRALCDACRAHSDQAPERLIAFRRKAAAAVADARRCRSLLIRTAAAELPSESTPAH